MSVQSEGPIGTDRTSTGSFESGRKTDTKRVPSLSDLFVGFHDGKSVDDMGGGEGVHPVER